MVEVVRVWIFEYILYRKLKCWLKKINISIYMLYSGVDFDILFMIKKWWYLIW